jgi:hypothetical protein
MVQTLNKEWESKKQHPGHKNRMLLFLSTVPE